MSPAGWQPRVIARSLENLLATIGMSDGWIVLAPTIVQLVAPRGLPMVAMLPETSARSRVGEDLREIPLRTLRYHQVAPMSDRMHGEDAVARAARRLGAALDALDAAIARQREATPARRETEIMAEDRARMADELMAARAEGEALRSAGQKAVRGVREARQAVKAALDEG